MYKDISFSQGMRQAQKHENASTIPSSTHSQFVPHALDYFFAKPDP